MKNIDQNIAILGAGNLGIAIAMGIVEKSLRSAGQIFLTRRSTRHLERLGDKGYQVTDDNKLAVSSSKIIILCVQPGQLEFLLNDIGEHLTDKHVIVSVITGIKIQEISGLIGEEIPVVRAMPNTSIAIGESMTCISGNGNSKAYLEEIVHLFDALGKTLVIEESLMKAATVLGASGVAFFMRYLRAATQGGIQMGFHPKEAQLIAVQTAGGAARLILESENHPEVEIDKVTTPQGCTIEGLNEMEHQGFSSALIKGLMTSYHKINSIK